MEAVTLNRQNKKIVLTAALLFAFLQNLFGQEYPFLSDKTFTYEEVIEKYSNLAVNHKAAKLLTYGKTDAGKPLHLFVISSEGDFDPVSLRNKDKRIVLVNNGIHPGEPCGVDACVKLAEELLNNKVKLPENIVLCIIPVYNIGGALNRGCCSRANQNGPEAYGFRGNARNLDLNRDFIKCDSENAKAFANIYHQWRPDIFIDTHTSNGADYQYVMTLIATQKDKLHPLLSDYMTEKMLPSLYGKMKETGYEMVPYVYSKDKIPDNGIVDYLETPRYSTGYTTLFNTIGFVTETHMFKPFKKRVLSTYYFLKTIINFTSEHAEEIGELRNKANNHVKVQQQFDLGWELDTVAFEMIDFNGYEAKYKPSKLSGGDRLYYDRKAPFTRRVKYYNTYKPIVTVEKPEYYILPQAWQEVVVRLQMNGIEMECLEKDTTIEGEVYYIENYETLSRPYEGHYLHSKVKVRKERQMVKYYQGDYVIPVNQPGNRYIVETLEPQAVDSYFNWNFFDGILQQKEWFSSYVFEDKAEAILAENPDLKKELESKKKTHPEFAENSKAQLFFIYRNSSHYEKTHNRYPVMRVR